MSSLDRTGDYWRSLGELEETREFQEFLDREFPEQTDATRVSRRRFMQLMGASLAFAGVAQAGCRRDEDHILPMSRRPDGYTPGEFQEYATAYELGGVASALLVRAYDGRPTKIEGNPAHPFSTGGSTALAQGSILHLYDPDRSRELRRRRDGGQLLSARWDEFRRFAREHFSRLREHGGAGLRFLSEATSSPTLRALRQEIEEAFPNASWHEYEPLSRDNEREGTRSAFGAPYRTLLRLDRAKTVLTLDADILVDDDRALKNAADFATTRDPDSGTMSRLYSVESHFSSTGALADHRLPLRSEYVLPFLLALKAELDPDGPTQTPDAEFLEEDEVQSFLRTLARDLLASSGESVIVAGYRQPRHVHDLVARINDLLGNAGQTVLYYRDPDEGRPSHIEDITRLAGAISGGEVDTLVMLGGNPAYTAPADLGFAELLGQVSTSIHLSEYDDETSAACTWHVPRAHYLEAWSDARTADGTVTIAQPVIEPIFGGRSPIEVLSLILDRDHESPRQLVRRTFDDVAGFAIDPDAMWRQALHDGFVPDSHHRTERPALTPEPRFTLSESQKQRRDRREDEMEVVFTPSSATYDGRYANNGWLQETPDFMTKLTWDNAALVSPKTARSIGLKSGEVVRLEVGGRQLELPVWVQPGQAPYSVSVALGYGRTRAGVVGGDEGEGVNPVGADSYRLRASDAPYFVTGVSLRKTGRTQLLASTQDHWEIDPVGKKERERRATRLVRQTTLEQFGDAPDFVKDVDDPYPDHGSTWQEWEYDGYKWGMATDMNKCVGCNACILACTSENNVPIVGKENVAQHREMHWIRIDRYFHGDPENPEVSHQPVACQHCENAPCETVCPVGATIHSSEGLNEMTYNRCIGTRYCANNCPYRVRRFNYLDYHEGIDEARNKVRHLLFNPEVTVRSRGVMEKCTFCVQRITRTRIEANNDRRRIEDGEVKTACQQACPTDAIVFGDLNDDKSRVRALHDRQRSYKMLWYLNTEPRNVYLARVRNPHPDLG